MTEKEYRAAEGIHYSLLKKVAEYPKGIIKPHDISDYPSVKQGKVFDLYMEGENPFDKDEYVFFEGETPTASLKALADATIALSLEMGGILPSKESILKLSESVEYQGKQGLWSTTKDTEKRLAKFDGPKFWDYVNFMVENDGKTIINEEIYNNAIAAREGLMLGEFTKDVFERRKIFQEPIIFDYKFTYDGKEHTVKCKVLPDMITFDDEKKIIYAYDFKFISGRSVYALEEYFYTKYYYLQASLYTQGLKAWAKEKYPEYAVFPYQFMAISDVNPTYGIKFDPTSKITLGLLGFDHNNTFYPGVNQLICDYHWHLENDKWDHRKIIYDNNGKVLL